MPDGAAHIYNEAWVETGPFQPCEIGHGMTNIVEVLPHHPEREDIKTIVINDAGFSAVTVASLIITRHQVHIHRVDVIGQRDGIIKRQ